MCLPTHSDGFGSASLAFAGKTGKYPLGHVHFTNDGCKSMHCPTMTSHGLRGYSTQTLETVEKAVFKKNPIACKALLSF